MFSNSGTPPVTAVIVTYNRLAELQVTLAATLGQPFRRVVVLDNASTDGTAEWLDSLEDKRLVVLHSLRNSGGAGGFKTALQWLRRKTLSTDEWLLLFDDDAQPAPDFLEVLAAHSLENTHDILVSAVYDESGDPVEMNRALRHVPRSLVDQFRFVTHRQFYVVDDYTLETSVEAASFVGLAIRAQVALCNLDLLREDFFIYFDDVFFTWGLTQRGYSGQFVPNLRFEHRVNVRKGHSINPPWKAYFYARNMLPLYRAYSPAWFWIPVAMRLCNLLLISARQRSARLAILRYGAKGFVHGLLGRFSYNPLVKRKGRKD